MFEVKSKGDFIKSIWTVPAIWAIADIGLQQPILTSMHQTAWLVNDILSWLNSVTGGVVGAAAPFATAWWAMYLSNEILNRFEFFRKHNYTRYWVNALTSWWAFAAWTAATPYVLWAAVWYALWKPIYNFSKEALKRAWRTPLLAVKWAWNWAVSWVKWQ